MFEADIHHRPLPTPTFDIYKVFEPLLCCLKGIWMHMYTIPPAMFAPDLGVQGCYIGVNDVITSYLRQISTSNHFPPPHLTYTKCLSYWYAVSRAYGCTLIPFHWPCWPQIWEFSVACEVKMMSLHHG
jgi:hypothetical protein